MWLKRLEDINRRILYYRDYRLLLKVLITSLRLSLACLLGDGHSLAALAVSSKYNSIANQSKEKITRYVNLCLFLRKKIGIKDACFFRSLLFCYILRGAGWDAKMNFGAGKEQEGLIGHCWVNQSCEKDIDYQIILSYP